MQCKRVCFFFTLFGLKFGIDLTICLKSGKVLYTLWNWCLECFLVDVTFLMSFRSEIGWGGINRVTVSKSMPHTPGGDSNIKKGGDARREF